MSGIVQHKSTSATGATQSVSLTLDSPVAEGNLLVAVISYSGFNSISEFDDTLVVGPSAPTYSLFEAVSANFFVTAAYGLELLAGGSYTLTVKFASSDSSAKHLHLFEINGYTVCDQGGTNITTTSTPSVQVGSNTQFANELVLAAFFDSTHSGEPFTAGSGFTAAETTGNTGTLFTEYETISAVGKPTASASILTADNVGSLILTFFNPGGGSGGSSGPSTVFLGSVRVLGSAPAGASNPFIGTVTVVGSAPAGLPNPYLGSVVLGTPVSGEGNPSIGEVVVVGSVPAGESDPFLGQVTESAG